TAAKLPSGVPEAGSPAGAGPTPGGFPAIEAPAAPEPRASAVPVWTWAVGGAGLTLLGIGVGFGVSALSAESSLQTVCGGNIGMCPASKKSDATPLLGRRDLDRNLFTAFAAAGGAAVVAAVVGITVAARKPAPASVTLTAFSSGNGVGIAVVGRAR